jgi:hypothetical protein
MVTMEADIAVLLENEVITYETALGGVNDEDTFHGIIDRFDSIAPPRRQSISRKAGGKSQKGPRPEPSRKAEKDMWWR